MLQRRRMVTTLAATAATLLAGPAWAQAPYPSRPITLVVPFAPGGGNDILARAIAPLLAERLGQPVVVGNKPGAGGNIGTDAVARAQPDGHTLLIASNQVTINPAIGVRTPFTLEKDFAPVSQIASVPIVLVAHPEQPYKTLDEFVRYARANSGKLAYSSPGNGTPQHLAGEVFANLAKTQLMHVPYRGTGPAIADVVGGQVPLTFATMASVMPFVESGKLRALGIAGQSRAATLPQLPTFGDAGFKNYEAALWYSLLAPARTPPAVVAQVNAALVQALQQPAVRERLVQQGFEPRTSTPAQARTLLEQDLVRWARVVSELHIKIEQ
ncbi:tripartite tricarboxylate transporter substrate binding protein [Pseudorhodoferax sp.]|uniref:tripartite tricarboxylate transporter substrate binding protein n=1 Tax=Pseudorhodoferax sp. TaxID=1993553 RepID=UPI002DD6A2D8|nr:tripartite tricarboxylate transporter substrate binding protein [Pseudorhodoferax sp.]